MHYYRIIVIKNQLEYLQLRYFGIEINLFNAVSTYLLISETNYYKNERK